MTPFFATFFLLGLSSVAATTNFNQVYEWKELDYEWPSEASRSKALKDKTFEPDNISPHFIAVYGSRLFLSLESYGGIPVTLVSLPTSSASSAPPKLTPFPSWDMHGKIGDCDKIEEARGLEVDSVGRLWVLDSGSNTCKAKLWTIDLANNDQTKLIHEIDINHSMHDLVLDETPNGTFAYITRWREEHIVVFSLERNQSWFVHCTPGLRLISIALSPKDQEPRQLYLAKSKELYSFSVAALHNGTRRVNPKLIGNWTGPPYRMLMDNQGTVYAAFLWKNYASSWNSSQPLQEQRFREAAGKDSYWPFTIALDQNGTLWMTVFDTNREKPSQRLLKAAVGAKSYMFEAPPE
ncbi:protein yellow-like isoform X2 [Cloeon dipterum]|uniref:protein yellow-like isoform X2 n=1 Tax=Cloeon dipterum TaxID=197152 RepID=UPI00321F78D5